MAKKLIAFYSRGDENYVNGKIKSLEIGNTKIAAGIIQELTGADVFQIEQMHPYAKEYDECTKQAKEDQQKNARPQLKDYPDTLDAYDVVYLGYPNYWNTMPMAVFTFLEHYDWNGKIIKPFCTHEGSGLGQSVQDIKTLCPGADIEKGLAIYGNSVEKARSQIEQWVETGSKKLSRINLGGNK